MENIKVRNIVKGVAGLAGGTCASFTIGKLFKAVLPAPVSAAASVAFAIGTGLIGAAVSDRVCKTISEDIDTIFDTFENCKEDIEENSFEEVVTEGEA